MVSLDVSNTYAIRLTCPNLHIQPKLGDVGQDKDPNSKADDSRPQLFELIKRGSDSDTSEGVGKLYIHYSALSTALSPPDGYPFCANSTAWDWQGSRTLGCVS